MPIVLGTRIATLGKGWERVTSIRQLKDGDIYYIPSYSEAGVYVKGGQLSATTVSSVPTYTIAYP